MKEEPSQETSQPLGFLRPKKEPAIKVKKEEPSLPPPIKKEKWWWKEEKELTAASRYSDDLEDAPATSFHI
jgi:hypothetical protein